MTEHRLTPLEHHDLELMVDGIVPPRFALPGSTDAFAPSLRLPNAPAAAVTLVDREATPVARVRVDETAPDERGGVWVAGDVEMLRPLHGAYFPEARPSHAPQVDGPAVLLVGGASPLPADDRAVIVVDSGEMGATWRAMLPASRAGREVRVLPEPSAAHLVGDARLTMLKSLARAAFGADEVEVIESDGPAGDGLVVLLTGLSGSGKSTIAKELAQLLPRSTDQHVTLLDGDEVRAMLSKGLGFSREDRLLNVQRIGWVAALVAEHGGIAIAAPIAPYAEMRTEMRERVEKVGRFVLVHVATPLEVCEARDRKGLYAKARAGEIKEFTGISDPYDVPTDADVVITEDQTPQDAALTILATLSVVAPPLRPGS